MATGVALPGLTAQEPAPAVNLLKVPVWGEKDAFLVLGLPGETPTSGPSGYPRGTWCSGRPPPEHGEGAVATGPGGKTVTGRFLGYTARRSYALETRKGVLLLEKADWELHQVVVEVRLYPDGEGGEGHRILPSTSEGQVQDGVLQLLRPRGGQKEVQVLQNPA
jgi:hypothetical protein